MTRINVVPPQELTRQHLLAEYRELPRAFALARRAQPAGVAIPPEYLLGAGHVRFFYNKTGWLVERFRSLVAEMERRGYSPKHRCVAALADGLVDVPWTPDAKALELNRRRIAERTAR